MFGTRVWALTEKDGRHLGLRDFRRAHRQRHHVECNAMDDSTVLQIRKAGAMPGPTGTSGAVTPGTGSLPSGTMGVQEKMTVTSKIDRSQHALDHGDHA